MSRGQTTTFIDRLAPCKAAVVNLARILSSELVDRGIRVNTLSPGPTDTAMFGRFLQARRARAMQVKELLARTNNPSKRLADPVEIAKLAVYSSRRTILRTSCRGRLPDRRQGHGHFGRWRLSLVAESRGRSCSWVLSGTAPTCSNNYIKQIGAASR